MDEDIDGKLAQQFGCMATSDKESLISQFCQILNESQPMEISKDACTFFLDMNNWNLPAALGSFYDFNAQEQLNAPRMCLVDDVTVGEGESVPPGTNFVKTWKLHNPGPKAWPEGCFLQKVHGSEMLESTGTDVVMPAASAGHTVNIAIELKSPLQPGIYQSIWRLVTPSQVPFGDKIWCIICVEKDGMLDVTQKMAATHCSELSGHSRAQNENEFVVSRLLPQEQGQLVDCPVQSSSTSGLTSNNGTDTWRIWEEQYKQKSLEEECFDQVNGFSPPQETSIDTNFELCRMDNNSSNESSSLALNSSSSGFCFGASTRNR